MNRKLLLIISIVLLLTGCYDKNELNKVSILTATEINKIDDEYIIVAEVVNPQAPEKTVNPQAPFIIYTGKGKTIQEAYQQIKLSTSRFLYSDQLQVLIINEQLAKEDISEIIDFYLRSPESRSEFNILIGKNDDILNTTTPIDEISSISISESIKTNQEYLGVSNLTSFNDFINMKLNPYTEIVIPSISSTIDNNSDNEDTTENTQNTEPSDMFKMGGLAIFKDNTLLGYLSEEESITYNLIKNQVENTIITYECDNNKYLSIEVITSNSKITTKNKKIFINLNIKGKLKELNCQIDLFKTNNIKTLETNLEKYLNERIINDITNVRNDYNSDIFGFLDTIYKYDYQSFLLLKDNWYEGNFKNIEINVKTNINLITTGNVMEGLYE